jgi:hypothetical protein
MSNPTDELRDIASVTRELNRNVLFTHVSVHRWRGHKEVEAATIKVEGETATETLVTKPRWKLLDDEWQRKFSRVETLLRNIVAKASPAFPIPGVYVIPRLRARQLFEAVDEVAKEQFYPLAEEFAATWPSYVANIRQTATEAQWAQINKALPTTATELRKKFRVTKHIIPLAGGAGLSVVTLRDIFTDLEADLCSRLPLSEHNKEIITATLQTAMGKLLQHTGGELTGGEADSYAVEIEQATRQFIQDTASVIAGSVTQELKDAVDNLAGRLEEHGVVRDSTIELVKAAFEKYKSFSFAANPATLARMHQVEHQLLHLSHKELNQDNRHGDGSIAKGLSDALKALRAQAEQDFAGSAAFGRRLRTIEV